MSIRKLAVAWVAVLLFALSCAPRVQVSAHRSLPLEAENLGRLSPEELDLRIARDAAALRHIAQGLDVLEARARAFNDAMPKARGYFTQEEDEQIRGMLLEFLSYRTALLRQLSFHSSYEQLQDERRRLRSFLVGYGALWTTAQKGVVLIELFKDNPDARRKLNEPEPTFGVPPNVFDTIFANLTRTGNVELLQAAYKQYVKQLPRMKELGVLDEPALSWVPADAARKRTYVRERAPGIWQGAWDQVLAQAGGQAGGAAYRVQSALATWLGDTRVTRAPPRVAPEAVQRLAGRLEPGDILLVRHEGYLSNGFLPGFWPHAALYVGGADRLEQLGLRRQPSVSARWEQFVASDGRGHRKRVVEALSDGVVFNSLEEALAADHVAVLRPRLSTARRLAAVERAFTHYGKRYDFEFDFFSSDKLVCTELVYRSYDEPLGGERLDLTLLRVMGRFTYPAQELVKKFKREWLEDDRSGRQQRQLDFVAFLSSGKEATLGELLATVP